MITFKQFVDEASRKKSKEPPFDVGQELGRLRDMQQYLTKSKLDLQLFVPKHRDPKVMRELETKARLSKVARELTTVKEDAAPLLTSYREAPPGNNKPHEGFWTSTAIKMDDGKYTSDWYKFVKSNFKSWQTDFGYLFEVQSGAMIFDVSNAAQFYEWAMDYNRMSSEKSSWAQEYSTDDAKLRFPWDELAKHFDAAHLSYPYSDDAFTYGWDVESTVWFNTKYLKYKGAVRLYNLTED